MAPLRLRCNENADVERQLAGAGEIARRNRVEQVAPSSAARVERRQARSRPAGVSSR